MKILYVFLALFMLLSNKIMACTCGGKSLETDYQNASTMVEGGIVGRKIKKYPVALPNGKVNRYTYYRYKVRVKQVYKGQPGKYFYVATAREGTTCGMPFKLWGWYLVSAFADKRYGESTSRCDANIHRKEFSFRQQIHTLQELIKKN